MRNELNNNLLSPPIWLLERRRMLMMSKAVIPALEHPDAYMVVFDSDAVETGIIYGNGGINRYILDGVETIPNSPVGSVTPSTNGTHVLYFWLGSSNRLRNDSIVKYLRVPAEPEYWHGTFLYTNYRITGLDFLGETPPNFSSNFGTRYNWYTNSVLIRVPVGCGNAYRQALASTGLKNQTIIETNNFNIDINNF